MSELVPPAKAQSARFRHCPDESKRKKLPRGKQQHYREDRRKQEIGSGLVRSPEAAHAPAEHAQTLDPP